MSDRLKQALDEYKTALTLQAMGAEAGSIEARQRRADRALASIEALFEELEAETVVEMLHEPTGNMLPVKYKTLAEALMKKLQEPRRNE